MESLSGLKRTYKFERFILLQYKKNGKNSVTTQSLAIPNIKTIENDFLPKETSLVLNKNVKSILEEENKITFPVSRDDMKIIVLVTMPYEFIEKYNKNAPIFIENNGVFYLFDKEFRNNHGKFLDKWSDVSRVCVVDPFFKDSNITNNTYYYNTIEFIASQKYKNLIKNYIRPKINEIHDDLSYEIDTKIDDYHFNIKEKKSIKNNLLKNRINDLYKIYISNIYYSSFDDENLSSFDDVYDKKNKNDQMEKIYEETKELAKLTKLEEKRVKLEKEEEEAEFKKGREQYKNIPLSKTKEKEKDNKLKIIRDSLLNLFSQYNPVTDVHLSPPTDITLDPSSTPYTVSPRPPSVSSRGEYINVKFTNPWMDDNLVLALNNAEHEYYGGWNSYNVPFRPNKFSNASSAFSGKSCAKSTKKFPFSGNNKSVFEQFEVDINVLLVYTQNHSISDTK
jgi:hypothetical protein